MKEIKTIGIVNYCDEKRIEKLLKEARYYYLKKNNIYFIINISLESLQNIGLDLNIQNFLFANKEDFFFGKLSKNYTYFIEKIKGDFVDYFKYYYGIYYDVISIEIEDYINKELNYIEDSIYNDVIDYDLYCDDKTVKHLWIKRCELYKKDEK